MRTHYSIKNSMTSLICNFIAYVIAFIAQAVFIRILGAEYLGINGLFSNILAMLSIFELGIGSAIVFNLYKPIAEDNKEKIAALANFYKKSYRLIVLVILIFGLCLLPFIKYIVHDINVDINIYIVYILFLISTVSSYFMAYKRNLIVANQQNYIINLIHVGYLLLLNIGQLLIIYFTKNYYLYLIAKIICQILENIVISIISERKYGYLKEYKSEKLDKKVESDIFSRVKALIFHKVGSIIVVSTDNIIISLFFGVTEVGLYTNYNTIVSAVTNLFGQVISTTTASVGNLLASGEAEKRFDIFNKMRFLNFWVSTFTSVCLLVIIQPFISIWVGTKYQLSIGIVFVIVLNYFQKMQRQTYGTFKDSAGIWREDKYVPLVESILNIVFSIICLKLFGLAGVFMGTIISGLSLWCYSYPKYVYKNLLGGSYKSYCKETIEYILIFIVIALITFYLSKVFILQNSFLQVLVNTVICLIVPNTILYLLYKNTDEFKYYKNLVFNIAKRK